MLGGLGERCKLPSRVRGRAQEALALFMFLEDKIQHLINIPAQNLLKLQAENVIYMKESM